MFCISNTVSAILFASGRFGHAVEPQGFCKVLQGRWSSIYEQTGGIEMQLQAAYNNG